MFIGLKLACVIRIRQKTERNSEKGIMLPGGAQEAHVALNAREEAHSVYVLSLNGQKEVRLICFIIRYFDSLQYEISSLFRVAIKRSSMHSKN